MSSPSLEAFLSQIAERNPGQTEYLQAVTEVLTILSIKRAYSPWNSKIHGLTPLPERK